MISCKTTTHGRPHLIVEAVHSFLIQEYEGESELIIVNDCPWQTYIFDHPKVKIYNLDEPFETMGEKDNFAIERCSGDVIATWDDDDIALPNHFKNIDKYLKDNNILFWNRACYYNEPNITAIAGVGNSGIIYTKKAWEDIGKTPLENAGYDQTLANKLKALDQNKVVHAAPPDEEVSWFYRWSLPQNFHQSGAGTDHSGRPSIVIRNAEYVIGEIAAGRMVSGEIQLVPSWRHDYSLMLKNYLK